MKIGAFLSCYILQLHKGSHFMQSLAAKEISESLNRTLKLALDEGDAATLEEAQLLFDSYRLRVRVGANIADSPTRQAMLFTVVNTAARCFLGGVEVELAGDARSLLPLYQFHTVKEVVEELGGQVVSQISNGKGPQLLLGDCAQAGGDGVLRLSFDSWCASVTPCDDKPLSENREFTLAGVLAGALGVSEAFQFVRGKSIVAGRRPVLLSLWKPELDAFANTESRGPEVQFLPAQAWLIGLGHLGQAYLWTLGMLPYLTPQDLHIVLQDTDTLQKSNLSTSILSRNCDLGQMKTRAMADWCAQRGFAARIQERLFSADFKVQSGEPKVALCGVDNPQARACLEGVGFDEIIEAGLGSQGEDYLCLRLHGFASGVENRSAHEIWGSAASEFPRNNGRLQIAYRDLEKRGMDACGLTTLAGRAVGASFVGTVAATFAVAETIRLTMNAHRYALLEFNLRNPQIVTARVLPPKLNRNISFTSVQ